MLLRGMAGPDRMKKRGVAVVKHVSCGIASGRGQCSR